MKTKLLLMLLIVGLLFVGLVSCQVEKSDKYAEAKELLAAGRYDEAYQLFSELGDHEDAQEYLKHFRYVPVKIFYQEDNDPQITVSVFYERGLPVGYVATANDEELEYTIYSHDASGRLIKKRYVQNDVEKRVDDYTYDENGNLVRIVSTLPDGSSSTEEYVYDQNRNLLRRTFSEQGVLRSADEYTYDQNGRVIQYISTAGNGKQTVTTYTYDANANLIRETSSYNGATTYTCDYSYDEKGNLIQRVYTPSEGDTVTQELTYDENNRLVEKVEGNSDGQCFWEYTYDANGNKTGKHKRDERYPSHPQERIEVEYTLVYFPYPLSNETESLFNIFGMLED